MTTPDEQSDRTLRQAAALETGVCTLNGATKSSKPVHQYNIKIAPVTAVSNETKQKMSAYQLKKKISTMIVHWVFFSIALQPHHNINRCLQ